MTRITIVLPFALLHFATANLFAQKPPPPFEVANTVSNLWIRQDFSGLNSYVTNLYAIASHYVPAILASVFHDSVYLGKLALASNKLACVIGCVTNNPQGFTFEFKDLLFELQSETIDEMDLHYRMGTSPETLQSNASPRMIRSAWGTNLLPHIHLLFYAPNTNAP